MNNELNALALAARTDSSAKMEVFERLQGLVLMLSRRRIAGYDTEDILQEGFLALWSAIEGYQSERGNFYAYARACIENRFADEARKASRKKRNAPGGLVPLEDGAGECENPDDKLINEENLKEIRSAVSNLSPLEKAVLDLYLNRQTYKQISESLGVSVKSVDNAMTRIKKKLKPPMDSGR